MKLLIDENLPKRLKQDFSDFEISTVFENGWSGKKNGELLLMLEKGFEVLLTFDKNLQFQQNFASYPINVIIFYAKDNTYNTLTTLTEEVKRMIKIGLKPGVTVVGNS